MTATKTTTEGKTFSIRPARETTAVCVSVYVRGEDQECVRIIMDLFRARSMLRNIQFLSFIFFLYPSVEIPSQKIFKELIRIERFIGLKMVCRFVMCV